MTTADKTVLALLIAVAVFAFGYEYSNMLEPLRVIANTLAATK
jgi:hypothetical protein